MHLAAVIAANGLGHMRRTTGVLARMVERGAALRVTLVAEEWQREAAGEWAGGVILERRGVEWVHGVTGPGVRWSTDPSLYSDGRLIGWEEQLKSVTALGSADVVVSDNLVGVLTVRPDAVLMGSFLWSDVLEAAYPSDPHVVAFVDHERSLLTAQRPEMVCVGDVVMPGVLERTQAVKVGWMCPPAQEVADDVSGVAILGGRTGAADGLLAGYAELLEHAGFGVVSDVERGSAEITDGPSRWDDVGVAVCRPGIGSLTDCIARGIPIVCVHERGNIELAHNAARVAELGFGVDLGGSASGPEVVDAVRRLIEPGARQSIRAAMRAADRQGLDGAAEWLAVRCGVDLHPRPQSEDLS